MRLIKFWAQWCGPCRTQSKVLEGYDIPVESIDVDDDDNTDIVDKYGVKGLPTLFLLNDKDEIIKRFNGFTPIEEINKVAKEYEQKQGKD